MAPLPTEGVLQLLPRNAFSSSSKANDLALSSLELDRQATPQNYQNHALTRRATTSPSTYTPCSGCKPPGSLNNQAFFALFAILGVAMVVASLWFFFWAKNGGFRWQEGDWEDYKTTVMRKKGPDGKTISCSRSTRFTNISSVDKRTKFAAKSVIARDEKGRKGILAKRGFGGTHSFNYADNFTDYGDTRLDDISETSTQAPPPPYHAHHKSHKAAGAHHNKRYRDRDIKSYRAEQPARVGGINREADGSHIDFGGSETMTDYSSAPAVDNHKRARAHQKAKEDAARMEREWKREADRAAAQAVRDANTTVRQTPASTPRPKARTPSPTKRPVTAHKQGQRSRSHSPKKRDFSYSRGDDHASNAYTASSGGVSGSSYLDAYRPHANTRAEAPGAWPRPESPQKNGRGGAGRDVMAGYRRGMDDI